MSNSIQLREGSIYLISGSSTPPTVDASGSSTQPSTTGSEYVSSFQLDPNDPTSFYISGSGMGSSIYMSSSGQLGFGTTDPLTAFDVRADDFQIQKTGKRQGIKVNKEGNLESFNSETSAAATGSEFILSYTRGGAGAVTSEGLQSILGVDVREISDAGGAAAFFEKLRPRDQDKILFLLEKKGGYIDKSNIGDVLGSIRWVSTSGSTDTFNSRTSGEAATIQATVNASNRYGTSADLHFKITDRAALEGASEDLGTAGAPKTALLLDGNFNHEMTGSLTSTGNIISPNITADSGSFSTRVTANDAKTGISTSQASAITANTAKTGISAGQASAITANTAKASMVIGTTNKTALAGNTTTISTEQAATVNNLHLEGGALIPTTTAGHTVSLSVTNNKGTYALIFTMVDSTGKSPVTKRAEVSLK